MMVKSYVQPANAVEAIVPEGASWANDQLVVYGSVVGLVAIPGYNRNPALAGDRVILNRAGKAFNYAKATGVAFTFGELVYLDEGADEVTNVAGVNPLVGWAMGNLGIMAAAGATSETIVLLGDAGVLGAVPEGLADSGCAPVAVILLSTNPTDTDTLTIGADTYEFTSDDEVADDSYIGVVIGVDAATTFASLLAAINGTATNPHPTVKQTDGVTPAAGIGTEYVYADDGGSQLLLLTPADAVGGTPVEGPGPNLALADGLTAVVSWSTANLNLVNGRLPGQASGTSILDITAAHITAGVLALWFPFEVGSATASVFTAAGALKAAWTDTVLPSGNYVLVTLNGGGTDIVATDVLTVTARE